MSNTTTQNMSVAGTLAVTNKSTLTGSLECNGQVTLNNTVIMTQYPSVSPAPTTAPTNNQLITLAYGNTLYPQIATANILESNLSILGDTQLAKLTATGDTQLAKLTATGDSSLNKLYVVVLILLNESSESFTASLTVLRS